MRINLNTKSGVLTLFVLLYVFIFLIPAWYTTNLTLPDTQSLHSTHGILKLVYIRKNGHIVTIKEGNTIHQLTCRTAYGGNHSCYPTLDPDKINGLTGVAHWYEQDIFPFTTQKRLAALTIDGKNLLTINDTIHNINLAISEIPSNIIFITVLWLSCIATIYAIYFRRK